MPAITQFKLCASKNQQLAEDSSNAPKFKHRLKYCPSQIEYNDRNRSKENSTREPPTPLNARSALYSIKLGNTHYKLGELCITKSEKEAYAFYKTETAGMWYELSADEAYCTTMHALAFDVDQSKMLQHLKRSRTQFKKSVNAMAQEYKDKYREHISGCKIMAHGREVILAQDDGFNFVRD